MSRSNTQYGVILQNGEYSYQLVIGTKNDGAVVMFPPANVAQENVLGYFESEEGAQLFIVSKKLEQAQKDLTAERQAHAATKNRAKSLLKTLGTFEDVI